MQDACDLGEGEEEGRRYLTLADISTHDDALDILTLHFRAHEIRRTPDERPRTAGTRAQKAEVPKLEINLTAQEFLWSTC